MFDPIYVRPNQYRSSPFIGEMPISQGDVPRAAPDVVGEMARRASDAQGLVQSKRESEENLRGLRSAAAQDFADYDRLKSKFVETYAGFDPMAGQSDEIAFSERAKAYLADLAAMEKKRDRAERISECAERFERSASRYLATYEAMTEMSASGWDMRFSPTKAARVEAANNFADAGNRMAKNGFENDYIFAVRDVRNAAVTAGNAALTEGLSGAALFKVSDSGRIDFDTKGLEHLSPDAQQVAQLKRLVEIMSVRNGLSPLRGAVAKALDIQNAYIASHPVVTGVVELPF